MSTALPASPAPGHPRWPALLPPVLIAIPVLLKLAGVDIANAWIIFALLFGLMLTGMPISISLGLTVLTYLFTMTTVPIESVALKLFTGIERFEIMAIPFFILAGNFLTHGGVARRMINFASAMVGHWAGGLGGCEDARVDPADDDDDKQQSPDALAECPPALAPGGFRLTRIVVLARAPPRRETKHGREHEPRNDAGDEQRAD